MKLTKIVLAITAIIFLTSSTPSLAVAGPNPTNTVIRQQIRQEKGELRGTIVQERKSFWTETKKRAVEMIYNRIKTNLQKRYQWLTGEAKNKIMVRIEAKEKAKNVDLADLKTKLNSISEYADDFASAMANLDAVCQQLLNLDQPFAGIQKLTDTRRAVIEVNNQIRKVEVEVLRDFWNK